VLTQPLGLLERGVLPHQMIGRSIDVRSYKIKVTLRPMSTVAHPVPMAFKVRLVVGYKKGNRADAVGQGTPLLRFGDRKITYDGSIRQSQFKNNNLDLVILKSKTFFLGHSTVKIDDNDADDRLLDVSDQKYVSEAVWQFDLARYLGKIKDKLSILDNAAPVHNVDFSHKRICMWAFYTNPFDPHVGAASGRIDVDGVGQPKSHVNALIEFMGGTFKDI
jgi:hypothetical protein